MPKQAISEQLQDRIVGLWERGLTIRQIAEETGVPRTTVNGYTAKLPPRRTVTPSPFWQKVSF